MTGALAYLTGASLRNRAAHAARQARSPRYLAALILGFGYLWLALLRPGREDHRFVAGLLGARAELIVTFGVLLYVAFGWFTTSARRSLAFSEAEVHFLFPAPLSRTRLVAYKIFRSQLLIAFNALIWIFVLRRGGGEGLPVVLRYLSIWIVLSNVAIHRLGATLVRISWQEHGWAGWRRQVIPAVVFGAVLVAIAVVLGRAMPALRAADGPGTLLDAVIAALGTPLATVVLYPVHLAVAPVFTHVLATWWRAMLPALGLALVQIWWVLRMDTAFEEAAAQASVDRARRMEVRRSRGQLRVRAKSAKRSLPLSPVGAPAMAILWKNALCLFRTGQVAGIIVTALGAGAVGVAIASNSKVDRAEVIAGFAFLLAGFMFVIGTRTVRNDLRQDMLHLDALKTLPLDGRTMVAAEVASAAMPIIVVQILLLIVGYAAVLMMPDAPFTPGVRAALFVAAPLVVAALDIALLAIHNGTAVLYPSWIRLGTQRASGIETLGQGILTTFASMLVLAIGLVPPAVASGAVLLGAGMRPIGIVMAAVLGSLVLLAETWWVVGRLGRAFERAEPIAA